MEHGKRPTLPRGLRWDPRSPHICFSWRDERGRQHQQSTHTDDPAKALAFRQDFKKENRDEIEERRARAADQSRLPLSDAAKMYFSWKTATNRESTIARERRIFKQVEKFVGASVQLRRIDLELIREYQQERRKQVSPTMRRAPIHRKAQLVLLCTTSLYGSALSQYSRVKVPADAIGGKSGEKIEYRSIGLSEGFGSFHISQETLGLMGTLIGRSKDARKVNSIFGEGVNPLMRKIREGMELLGLPSEVLMNHGNKRVVYGVALARNFRDLLLGFKDSAQYSVPLTRDKVRTEMLADFWRRRWLLNRLALIPMAWR